MHGTKIQSLKQSVGGLEPGSVFEKKNVRGTKLRIRHILAWWGVIGAGCDGISTHMCTYNTCTPLFKTYTMDKYSWVIHHQQPERVLGGFKKLSFHFLTKHEVCSHIFFS